MMHRIVIAFAAVCLSVGGASAQPTYARDVAPIMQAKCQICHHDGDVAPFSLNNYNDAVTWASDTARVLQDGTMPPWKPVPGYGTFRDSYGLTPDEKQTYLDWINQGQASGDPADLPPPVESSGDWSLGTPDLVLTMPQDYTPAPGSEEYRCFLLPTGFDSTKYLTAIDIQPGSRQIVHHAVLYLDGEGLVDSLDGADGKPGYSCFGGPGGALDRSNLIAGWAPGQQTRFLPDGIAVEIPSGPKLILQVHYFTKRSTGVDRTRLGLYFSKTPVQRRLYNIAVVNTDFVIPANATKNVKASLKIPEGFDVRAVRIYPHMHLIGQQIKVDATLPDKTQQPLVYIDNWDFAWQGNYTYDQPIPLPSNTVLNQTCSYDNTEGNPRNPNNPIVPVYWGEHTTDDMCLSFVGIVWDNDPTPITQISNFSTRWKKAVAAAKAQQQLTK